jgi:hypothetical protein
MWAPRGSSASLPNRLRSCSLFLIALLLLSAAQLPGQQPQQACPTGPISFIFIDNHSIFDTSEPALDRRFGWAYRLANALHVRTRRSVIERELLFGPGDCFDQYMLDETERLLRAYQFLSQVDLFGVPQPDGSYHVIVDTQDQWSTQVDLRVGLEEGFQLEGFRLRETNVLGTGQELGLFYNDRDVTRDYGVAFSTPQLAGTRWDLSGALGRTRAGTLAQQVVAYPFVGEVGHWAARQSFTREDQFFDYITFDSTRSASRHLLLPVREKIFDVGLGVRIGGRGNLTVLGAMVSFEELGYPGVPQMTVGNNFDERVPADSATAALLARQTQQLGSIRFGALLGQRNIWWVKRRGYDSMRGQQDIPLGAEVGIAFARSIPALERDDDLIASFRLYTGIEYGEALFVGRVRADVRRDFDAIDAAGEWKDLYAESELLNYWKPSALPRHTFLLRAAATAAWNTRTPFQLTLGGDRNLRGYREERFPGGRRLVVNAEDRIYFGWPWREVFDLGATLFVDAGQMWPGDVPFGGDSGWRATAGAGLRVSFPAGSRSSFRIDLAAPIGGLEPSKFRLILSASELLGITGSNTPDVQLLRSRKDGVSGELFRFR